MPKSTPPPSPHPDAYAPGNVKDLPQQGYMVYMLFCDSTPIVLGHGKLNRARVIFDDISTITSGHIKALFVRLHHLYGRGDFHRYVIPCLNKAEAQRLEKELHREIGGNTRDLPESIRKQIFEGMEAGGLPEVLLKIMLASSFDGLADLKNWRNNRILPDPVWQVLVDRLRLHATRRNKA